MIYLIDNYDSFAYNLYQLVGQVEPDITVIRNDAMTPEELEAAAPEALLISPGPGRPEDAGICIEAVRALNGKIPILGVCLGHQVIVEALGGHVGYAKELMHGKASDISISTESPLFEGLPETIHVGRYHSLSADSESLPDVLKVTGTSDDGEIMAVEHIGCPTYGLQFHPESVLTDDGLAIMRNFMNIAAKFREQNNTKGQKR
ncbi:MAG: aminodeoxychorismate/anthranilate synthase component II [Eggerthellaceae bacterium]|nr:aminodeoxychorismate/anthranilate synthase component II [Eggerthellaceae bacterium]